MSGARLSNAGTPMVKKRRPGHTMTTVISTHCSSHATGWDSTVLNAEARPGMKCPPIS